MKQIKPDYICPDPGCKAKATIKGTRMGVDHTDLCQHAAKIYERWPMLATRIFLERTYKEYRLQSDAEA